MEHQEELKITVTPGWRLWYGLMNVVVFQTGAVGMVGLIFAPWQYKKHYFLVFWVSLIIFLIGLWRTRHTHGGLDENQPAE